MSRARHFISHSKMPKRRRLENDYPAPPRKKARLRFDYGFSLLSDELVLKVLSYLPVSELAVCQRCVPRTALKILLILSGSVVVFSDWPVTPKSGRKSIMRGG